MARRKVSRPRRSPRRARAVASTRGGHRYDVIPIEGDSLLHGVNTQLEYAGQAVTADGTLRAVHVTRKGTKLLGTLGGSASSARDINDAGAIVGGSLIKGDDAFHAFLYEDGVMHDLNDLIPSGGRWQLVQALGINARGDIVALGHQDGADRVVLLKRRPVPSTAR
jgi:probable HAF family extracellular repeat protein